jgi:hypothetical protein
MAIFGPSRHFAALRNLVAIGVIADSRQPNAALQAASATMIGLAWARCGAGRGVTQLVQSPASCCDGGVVVAQLLQGIVLSFPVPLLLCYHRLRSARVVEVRYF